MTGPIVEELKKLEKGIKATESIKKELQKKYAMKNATILYFNYLQTFSCPLQMKYFTQSSEVVFWTANCLCFLIMSYISTKTCQQFVTTAATHMPEFSKRLKTHLILPLIDDKVKFGPTDCYNTERSGQPRVKAQEMGSPEPYPKVCTRYGKDHLSGKDTCLARMVKCHKCGKVSHYQRVYRCLSTIEKRDHPPDEEWKFLGTVTAGSKIKPWMTSLNVNNCRIQFKIDMGADVTVIPYSLYSRCHDGVLQRPTTTLVGLSRYPLNVKGCFEATMEKGETKAQETICSGRATITIGRKINYQYT
uniref:Peptidase A2 domain-containing protein n=1 Tax=Amphimedon queenslandica TaxID=400682 RepID=A0A1X7TPL4_AMPQE